MTLRPFLSYPDKRLKMVAEPIANVTPEIEALWDDMLETMYKMPGIGLAAPQIGVGLRVIVVDASARKNQPLRMANPEILATSPEKVSFEEGSPNLPGVSAKVIRPRVVTISYMEPTGIKVRKEFKDIWAVSVLHQIDHLNGRLYIDNLSPVKRKMLIARSAKLGRREG